MPVSAAVWWQGKATFLLELVRNYAVLVCAGLWAILVARRRIDGDWRPDRGEPRGLLFIGAIVIGTGLISMIPHPVHVTYAGILVPPASALCGVVLAGALERSRFRRVTHLAWTAWGASRSPAGRMRGGSIRASSRG
jgi:hypothetical protein